MIELLREAAADVPDQPALVTPARELTYAELTGRAEAGSGALRARGINRFAILDDDPGVVWPLLAAARLAGSEVCVYPPASSDQAVAELRERLGHETLVTTRADHGDVVHPEALLESGDHPDQGPPADGRLLILTTGTTTGRPQAAQHEWSRLLRVADRIRPTPDQRWLLAYGLNQFAGFQILLHVSAAHATLIAADSVQPADGLTAIRRWDVTHASATPTFWRFLLAEMRRDRGPAPRLQQVTLGGEAVPSSLIRQLTDAFPDARISQLYAATELGSSVSVRDGVAGLPLGVLEEGGDVQFRIVDGELWVRSATGMIGYVGQEPVAADGWRATGDQVEVVGDRIVFRGRTSEVINVGGVKVHPLPIEERVCAIDGVDVARAFGRPNAMVGHIVALEVVPAEGADEGALEAAIREACAELPPAARPRSIKFVPTVDTAGTKLIRRTTA